MNSLSKQQILAKYEDMKYNQLVASLAIDGLGMLTFLLPALGEVADIIIAPITAIAIYRVHKTTAGAVFGLAEEILPFTDIIPTATLIWFKRYYMDHEETLNQFSSELENNI